MDFSNREISIFFWITVAIVFCLFHKSSRKAFKDLVKIIFSRSIISYLIIIYGLLFILVYFLYKWDIWEFYLLKDTLLWGISVPLIALIKATESKGNTYFKETLKECFELIILVEFLGLTYTFSLIVEIILIPIVLFLALAGDLSEQQVKSKVLANIFNIPVCLIGLFAFYHSIKLAIADHTNLLTFQTLKEVLFTPLLTLTYIPLILFFTIYAKYETLFLRLTHKKNLTKKEIRKKKWEVFKICKFNLKKIDEYKVF